MRFADILMAAATQAGGAAAALQPAPTFISATGYVSAASDSLTFAPFALLDLSAGSLAVFCCSAQRMNGVSDLSSVSTGWTNAAVTTVSNNGDLAMRIFYKLSPTNSETLAITADVATQYSGFLILLSGANNISLQNASGKDPPSVSPGSTQNYMALAFSGEGGNTNFTAGPAGYSNFANRAASGASGATTAFANLAVTGSSINPGAFTNAAAVNSCRSYTVGTWLV